MRNNNVVSGADVIPTVYAANVVFVLFQSIVACLLRGKEFACRREARGPNSKAVSTKIMSTPLCARVSRLTIRSHLSRFLLSQAPCCCLHSDSTRSIAKEEIRWTAMLENLGTQRIVPPKTPACAPIEGG